MKKHYAYIVGSLIGSLALLQGLNVAYLQNADDINPHFWVVTTEEENNTTGPLLDRYIADIRPVLVRKYPNIIVEKKLLSLDQNQSNSRQAYTVATTLENGFFNENLKGALLVALPLPSSVNKGLNQVSLLPYSDFENKYFVFNTAQEKFLSQEALVRENIHPEIFLGYLPDLTPAGFQGYFDANHSYYSNTTAYNRAIFFNDQIHDDQLWNNLDQAIHSPIDTQPFNPQSYENTIKASEKAWKAALRSTRRWQSLPSISSSQIKATFDSWYDEPVLGTMAAVLPAVGQYFLELNETQDPAIISTQENAVGEFLTQLGVFSSTIAINHRLFSQYPAALIPENVCNNVNPLPDSGSEEIERIRNQINTLKAWVNTIPRGSLLAEAANPNLFTVNGTLVGKYFIIRPGALVRSISDEPATIKTILIDPSAVTAEFTVPRGGFNHPNILEGADNSWTTNNIGDEQIKELIGWHYFLNPTDQYLYFSKNRLPPLNQFSSLPDTYEIAYNNLDEQISQYLNGSCLNNRSPETKSLLSIYTGHVGLVANASNLTAYQELRSGASLASLVISGTIPSQNHSFDDSNMQFPGLKDLPLFSSWAGGDMLGQALLPGLNENVNLLGDPCLLLPS